MRTKYIMHAHVIFLSVRHCTIPLALTLNKFKPILALAPMVMLQLLCLSLTLSFVQSILLAITELRSRYLLGTLNPGLTHTVHLLSSTLALWSHVNKLNIIGPSTHESTGEQLLEGVYWFVWVGSQTLNTHTIATILIPLMRLNTYGSCCTLNSKIRG